jgi:hypothetical protein
VNQSSISPVNDRRDWRIFADYGQYLIDQVRPMYVDFPIPNINLKKEVFALHSTTNSLSLKLFSWALGKYSRGAIKMNTLLDLSVSIPSFIMITDVKYHDSSILYVIVPVTGAIYLIDKAYIDFAALYTMHDKGAFFVSNT